ncbi:MAG: hypothetical protein ONB48_02950 [candidate division KSB1 bacterium]|nr:hypothetical protein [candidate division KSB1 bacterium]MDZ7275705.1 hypothetical protein [candidate division KSB1 bacterium]MDZ7284604.1 hypothetical protein [candidate division KSB1 bacterium]MDZ7297977.1 hypothetical protein [candidate division KSB1 bacterium]MDZ7305855.1 hypothetical protein [candidate division KSB1 bacterium]
MLLLLLLATAVPAQEMSVKKNTLAPQPRFSTAGAPRYTLLNLNNFTTWMRADGQSNHTPAVQKGGIFPRGTAGVIYQDGVMWGDKAYIVAGHHQPAPFNQLVRVGGANFLVGTQAESSDKVLLPWLRILTTRKYAFIASASHPPRLLHPERGGVAPGCRGVF